MDFRCVNTLVELPACAVTDGVPRFPIRLLTICVIWAKMARCWMKFKSGNHLAG